MLRRFFHVSGGGLELESFAATRVFVVEIDFDAATGRSPDPFVVAPLVTHFAYPSNDINTRPSGALKNCSPWRQSPRLIFDLIANSLYPVSSLNRSIVT
ncbi:hypothetical protein ACLUEY_01120 [Vreelandella aquamarina]